MIQAIPRSIDDTLLAVTGTATTLYSLIDTASSSANSAQYYGNATSPGEGVANCVSLRAQDGDIRIAIGATPTATKGFLIKSGVRYFFKGELSKLKLIRTGSSNVAVEALLWFVDPGESVSGNTDTSNLTLISSTTVVSGTTTPSAITAGEQNVLTDLVYNTTAPSPTNGQRVNAQSDPLGNLQINQYTRQFGEDPTNDLTATQNKPVAVSTYAWSVDKPAALEASTITKASAAVVKEFSGVIDSTCPTGTYYIMPINSATLPADGAVTTFAKPMKYAHVIGKDTQVGYDYGMNGVYASSGAVFVLSTSDFTTKTIAGAYLNIQVLFV